MQRIIHALVDARLDPPMLLTQLADLRHLPGHEVAKSKPFEMALFVELIYRLHCDIERSRPIGPLEKSVLAYSSVYMTTSGFLFTVQIPHVDFVCLQGLEG